MPRLKILDTAYELRSAAFDSGMCIGIVAEVREHIEAGSDRVYTYHVNEDAIKSIGEHPVLFQHYPHVVAMYERAKTYLIFPIDEGGQ